jgi:hypothetical protein
MEFTGLFSKSTTLAIIQVGRPIRYPVETYPLIMADAQTLSPQDMIAMSNATGRSRS